MMPRWSSPGTAGELLKQASKACGTGTATADLPQHRRDRITVVAQPAEITRPGRRTRCSSRSTLVTLAVAARPSIPSAYVLFIQGPDPGRPVEDSALAGQGPDAAGARWALGVPSWQYREADSLADPAGPIRLGRPGWG
jgi:hypothetical protein